MGRTDDSTDKNDRKYRQKTLAMQEPPTEGRSSDDLMPHRSFRIAASFAAKLLVGGDAKQTGDATGALYNIAKIDGPSEVLKLIARIDIAPGLLKVRLCADAIAKLIHADPQHLNETNLSSHIPFQLRKRGVETKIILADAPVGIDETLIRNIAKAHVWFERIKAGETFTEIARAEAASKRRIQQMIDLALLAPDVIRDVMEGKQPFGFTSDWCLRHNLPTDWMAQRQLIAAL